MSATWRTAAVLVLAIGGLLGGGAGRASAQSVRVYRSSTPTWGAFQRSAPVYYPRRVNNWGMGYYSRRPYLFPSWRRSSRGYGIAGRRGW